MNTTNKTDQITSTVSKKTSSRFGLLVRRLVLFAGPIGAAIAMWFHPHAEQDVYASLSPVVNTFVWTHILLFASLALIAVGLFYLSVNNQGQVVKLAQAGTGIFAFFYLGFVAIVGVAKGLLIREGQTLPAAQQAGVAEVVQYLHTDPMLFAPAIIGVIGYLVAVSALAIVYYRADAPRIPLVLLVISVISIGAHQGPIAVAGMVSFAVAVGWLELGWTPQKINA